MMRLAKGSSPREIPIDANIERKQGILAKTSIW